MYTYLMCVHVHLIQMCVSICQHMLTCYCKWLDVWTSRGQFQQDFKVPQVASERLVQTHMVHRRYD